MGGGALRQAFGTGLWNRLSILWKVVIVLATLVLVLLLVVLFQREPERKLHVGDTATLGLFDYRFRKITCHRGRKDLPEPLKERPFLFKGQLCFAYFLVGNSSDESRDTYRDPILLPERGSSTGPRLRVGKKEYEPVGAPPTMPATLFPEQEAPLTVIFDIPRRVEPTTVTLKDGQGDEVEWEIR